MSEEIKDTMDALENNELKNDGFWGRACSRLSQQLKACKEELQAYKEDRFCQGGCTIYQFDKIKQLKEENEKLKIKLNKPIFKEYDTLTQQNKQMRVAINNIKNLCNEDWEDMTVDKFQNQLLQALKGGE